MKGDYANSRIYRIVCNDTGKQYYGSTTQSLAKRLSHHKTGCKRWQEGKCAYTTSFEIIAGGNYDIVLVEECSDIKNIEQLRARERFHIESNECVNKFIPGRTLQEWYVDNKEKRKQYKVEYNALPANKEKMKQYSAKYRAANKDAERAWKAEKVTCPHCSSIVSRTCLPRHQRTAKCLAAQDSDL